MTDESKLTGLPEFDPTEEYAETPAVRTERVRTCDDCGNKKPRIAATSSGVTAYCSCGKWWAISSAPIASTLPEVPPRGLSKTTLVEPDWNKAFDDTEGENHGEVGPKRRG